MATDTDPDATTPPRGGGAGKESWLGPKGSRKRTTIQIGIGVLGLLIAFLVLRSQRSAAAASQAAAAQQQSGAPASPYGYPTVGPAGGIPQTSGGAFDTSSFTDALAGLGSTLSTGFANQQTSLAGLQTSLNGLPAAINGPSTATVSHIGPASGNNIQSYEAAYTSTLGQLSGGAFPYQSLAGTHVAASA